MKTRYLCQARRRLSPAPKLRSEASQACTRRLLQALLGLALLVAGIPSFAQLSDEVSQYLKQRETCDHWRNEEGYDKARRADIHWFTCKTCSGTDARLRQLTHKYQRNAAVMQALGQLDQSIEPSPAQTRRQCSHIRKPHWLKK